MVNVPWCHDCDNPDGLCTCQPEPLQWSWRGMYGDDPEEIITIGTPPEDLPEEVVEMVRDLYKDTGEPGEYYTRLRLAVSLNLCREIGNAWNKSLLWAPQWLEFVEK